MLRLLVLECAWKIDNTSTQEARTDIAVVKFTMSKVLREVSFNALQIHGSLGTTDLTPLQEMYASAPTMGLADGADEVHKSTVARRVLKGYRPHEGYWPASTSPTRRKRRGRPTSRGSKPTPSCARWRRATASTSPTVAERSHAKPVLHGEVVCGMAGRIDTHHHVVPPEYAKWLRTKGQLAGGLPIPEWSPTSALELMDRHRIDTAVLSVSTPGTHLGDGSDAAAMARLVNDYASAVVSDLPGRFGFFATLPLPDVDAALVELARALDELRRRRRAACQPSRCLPRRPRLRSGVRRTPAPQGRRLHPPVNTSRTGSRRRHPAVRRRLPSRHHESCGQSVPVRHDRRCPDVPMILSRGRLRSLRGHAVVGAASPTGNAVDGLELLSRFYFDTALSGSPCALPSLLSFARPGHVLFGTDWPYAPDAAVAAFTGLYEKYLLDEDQRASIDRNAAASLLPRARG
ncbi:MAG: amidohydrolase family protein [Acidimicrobiales bacterium]